MKIKSILVIGSEGLLGQALIRQAKQQGIKVYSTNHKTLDITNKIRVKEILDRLFPTVVINTAVYHNLAKCESNTSEAIRVNGFAVGMLAEESYARGIRFVTYSTDYVFDGEKNSAYVEYDITHPLQAYGFSKLVGELSASRYLSSMIIRTSMLFGLNSSPKPSFIDSRLADAKNKREVRIKPNAVVSMTYTEDLAAATLELLKSDRTIGRIFHLVNEGEVNLYNFTARLFKLTNVKAKVIPSPPFDDKIRRPRSSALLNTQAKELGVTLPSIENALDRYLDVRGLI